MRLPDPLIRALRLASSARSLWGHVVAVFGGLPGGLGLRVQLLAGEPVVGASAGDGVALPWCEPITVTELRRGGPAKPPARRFDRRVSGASANEPSHR